MNSAHASVLVFRERLLDPRLGGAFVTALLSVLGTAALEWGSATGAIRIQTLRIMVVPLWAYLLIARVAGGGPLSSSIEPLARVGIDRRWSVVWLLVMAEIAAALSSAILSACGWWWTHGTSGPSSPALGAVLWVGATGGASYAALIGLGATFGRRGRGGVILLVLDWLLGTGVSAMAAPWPRAYLRQLLGSEPVMGLPPWSGSLALLVLILLSTGWAAVRIPP
jgi:hypothetical protein